MKKGMSILIIVVSVVTLMLSGCHQYHNSQEQKDNKIRSDSPDINIEYEEGVYHSKKWNSFDLKKTGDTISNSNTDRSTAISIACTEFEKVQQKGVGKDYVLTGVFYDTEDEVWVVYFSPESIAPGN